MTRLGGEPGTGTILDGQTLRIAGLVTLCCVAAVTAASLGTAHGLSMPGQSGTNAATAVADVGAVAALVEFAVAHPAYPVLALVALVLVVAGDETPLLG
ncbi:hypothetical protein I7X12_09845 [Halosimplex litoreum]|uniref:Uncharacterized protein n=1 Tax=Halosimplex litoreum TaxID=1198301 RepID=A0A7U3WB84_9EURY|nr:hypothetical protein [Halosimplex litoreum]QPV64879.1 hypothetical protein I7X12_09845 [Halosimplex litoreum]